MFKNLFQSDPNKIHELIKVNIFCQVFSFTFLNHGSTFKIHILLIISLQKFHSGFQQVEKQKQTEEDLLNKISHLEEKQSEDDVMLCGINRYWKIFDENCRLFTKQFETESDIGLFDKSKFSIQFFSI